MNDHDIRQLEAMRSQIQAFRAGAIDLPSLISSLESLRHALQAVAEAWVNEFWSKWGVLEEIYSLSVVREERISVADQVEVGQVLDSLEAMITRLLPEPAPDQ